MIFYNLIGDWFPNETNHENMPVMSHVKTLISLQILISVCLTILCILTGNPLFVCVDALHPSQQFLSYVGMISCLPGLSTKQEDEVSCSKTQQCLR